MNKQPFYHNACFDDLTSEEIKKIIKAVKAIPTVKKSSVSLANNELLFMATSDVSDDAETIISKIAGEKLFEGIVDCEPGDPADLM